MKFRNDFRAVVLTSGPVLLTAGPADPRAFDAVTLQSPDERRGGQFGRSVRDAGDVDRDGYPDVIVGAPFDGVGRAGRAYVFSGRDASLILEIQPPNPGALGGFGYSVAGLGDVNQDGFPDLIVGGTRNGSARKPDGSPAPQKFIGRAYVISGQDGSLLFEIQPQTIQIRPLPILEVNGSSGTTVAAAGDVNRDGIPDALVGTGWETSLADPRNCGRAYIFSGLDGSLVFELIPPSKEKEGRFGDSVGGLGDVNHDGYPDVIVGAWGVDPGTSPDFAGRAYVISGRDASLLFELASPHEERSGFFGWSVAGAGDVNGDGTPDALVGARAEDPGASPADAGRAYVFSGQDGSVLFELVSPDEEVRGNFGWSTGGVGDVNGDGRDDVIVGALRGDPGASPENAGQAYVVSGRDGSLLISLSSPNEQANGHFGASLSGAGDLDQDGVADLIVGALGEKGGRAYLFLSGGAFAVVDDNGGRR